MRRTWQVMILGAAIALLATPSHAAEYQIVAHPTVKGTKIKRGVLADIYQKDVIRWGNQVRIRPVDQSGETPVRMAFSRDILGRTLGELQSYWVQRMATDRELPPTSKASDAEVLAFVASKKGAIGYVSSSAEVPADVKVITLIE